MIRVFAVSLVRVSLVLSCFTVCAFAQTPPVPGATPQAGAPPARPAAKKTSPKAKAAVRPPAVKEHGPCKLGVISAIGDRFSVQKFGVTVFETEENEVPVDWGFDDLVAARVRAATGADPMVHRTRLSQGRVRALLPSNITIAARSSRGPAGDRPEHHVGCELRTLSRRHQVQGAIAEHQSDARRRRRIQSGPRNHPQAFAICSPTLRSLVLDGRTYERIRSPFANFGTRFAESMRLTEDPLTKLDNSFFPEPAAAVATNVTLRDRTRALIAAKLDQTLPAI